MKSLQKLFLCLFLAVSNVQAQESWLSPEVEQMYRHASEYTALGNYKDAIITYKQALLLAPGKMQLYKGLANANYLGGMYADAIDILSSSLSQNKGDAESYHLLVASQLALKDVKQAYKAIRKGVSLFPDSGRLYYDYGIAYTLDNKPQAALEKWISGIKHAPAYALNYREAAKMYLNSEDVFWGLIYGEIFLAMKHDTAADDALKQLLFRSWKKMFDGIANKPAHQSSGKREDFKHAVTEIYRSLTPVISDGVTTENLTMVRTRFLMDWFSLNDRKYPFSLFSWQDNLIRTGHFEIYNQWLFGKAENEKSFISWNIFHEGDMARFIKWKEKDQILPKQSEFDN